MGKRNTPLDAEGKYNSDVQRTVEYVERFDILETINNVGNDEVFTPRKVVDMMLDALPDEVWHNPDYRWLNPASKTGIFEREIALRLDEGLKTVIPDTETRRKHIIRDMIFSIGQTKFTANVARRTLYYCCQANRKCDGVKEDGHYVNGYAIGGGTWFDDAEGNVKTPISNHLMNKDKCVYCGISKDSRYLDMNQREKYSYDFIHCEPGADLQKHLSKRFFKGDESVKFDVIVGNPPYQLSTDNKKTDKTKTQAIPIYQLFAKQAFSLNPRYVTMITPSKWFAGGMSSLESYRDYMTSCSKIRLLVDYPNAKDCFPSNSVGGGVSYFLWDREYDGPCEFVNVSGDKRDVQSRMLNEFPTLIRFNNATSILRKIKARGEPTVDLITSPLSPFGFPTDYRGDAIQSERNEVRLYSSGGPTYISKESVVKRTDLLYSYKVMVSKMGAEHALEPDSDGKFRIITSSMKVLEPGDACTHSYFLVGQFDSRAEADSLLSYLRTKFARFLILLAVTATNLTRNVFIYLPQQELNTQYTDKMLYSKYELSQDEIDFIEGLMKEMCRCLAALRYIHPRE